MTEWGVVGVIIALVGLGAAIVKPILSLNSSILRLTLVMEQVQNDLMKISAENDSSHAKIHIRIDAQQNTISDHENRIVKLEYNAGDYVNPGKGG